MIALTLCVFYVSMYVKEVLLLMTGSAMDEDGSKEYSLMAATSNSCVKANDFTLEALWLSPIYFRSRGGPQINQNKLF